jgi:cbb3-type cytochrome oxidase subunit 3
MGLADVIGHAGLSGFTVVAMILFMAAFVAVVAWTFAPRRRRELDETGRLPLDDETAGPAGPGADA